MKMMFLQNEGSLGVTWVGCYEMCIRGVGRIYYADTTWERRDLTNLVLWNWVALNRVFINSGYKIRFANLNKFEKGLHII